LEIFLFSKFLKRDVRLERLKDSKVFSRTIIANLNICIDETNFSVRECNAKKSAKRIRLGPWDPRDPRSWKGLEIFLFF
jgi:hypothetical protein